MAEAIKDRPRVLILGGGFAGIGAARELKHADADVTLVDKHNYHTFQPLLYQLATDLLETDAVGHPIRDLFHKQPNVTVHNANATSIDLDKRRVQFDEIDPIEYDYLLLGLGAEANFFGTEGAVEHAFPMDTLPDALRLKEHILGQWEAADRDPSLVADGALNVVVVGGGPTGVESVGALAELYAHDFVADYPDLPVADAQLTIVEAGPTLFSMFNSEIREYTYDTLTKRGVEVLVHDAVKEVTSTRVTLASGRVLKAHTLVWGAGLHAHPLAQSLGVPLQKGGRVPTGADLQVEEHPGVFAVGDVAWCTDAKTGDVLPQLGSVALQTGDCAGTNIAHLLQGEETRAFEYTDKGTMATIGRGAAVIQFRGGHTMTGRMASLAWGAVHLALLSTGEDRAKTVIDWTWAGFTHERSARTDTRSGEPTEEVAR